MRMIAVFFFAGFTAGAQTIGANNTAANAVPDFKTSSQLVVETVVVNDSSGRPVEGLTAKDFTVTEDGARQTIRLFEFQKLPESIDVTPLADGKAAKLLEKLPHTQIMPEATGDTRYKDRRLLALYFDMTAMPEA